MLSDRIIGAFTFRKGIYAEVEKDLSFTNTAWLIVVVVAFLNQVGANAARGLTGWIIGAVVGTIFAVIGFAAAAFVINLVGRSLFKAEVDFNELVRTLGLAYVWQAIGFLGILSAISLLLTCVVAPIMIIGFILLIVAWFIAAKEALDLSTGQTIVTVIVGWLVLVIVTLAASAILAALGFGAAAIGGALGA